MNALNQPSTSHVKYNTNVDATFLTAISNSIQVTLVTTDKSMQFSEISVNN